MTDSTDIDEKKNQTVISVDVLESGLPAVEPLVVKDKEGKELRRAEIVSQPVTTKWELFGYALYYFANNSTGPYTYTPTAFQNILNQGGYDADKGKSFRCTDSTNRCYINFGSDRSIDSVVLICQGIGFTLQTVIFLFLGGFADYGNSGSWILIGFSILSWGVQIAWIGVHDGSKYPAAIALSILASFGYQGCQSFWTALFPSLARGLPKSRELEGLMLDQKITEDEYYAHDEHYRNKISNYSWAFSNVGIFTVSAVSVGILFGIHSRKSESQNNWGISVVILWATLFWIVFGIPWFFIQKKRINQHLPPNTNYFTLPFKQLAYSFKSFKTLKQTSIYLLSYWLLGDGLNTSLNLQSILQNDVVSYDMISVSLLNLLNAGCSIIGVFVFWFIQQKYKLSTKTMFMANSIFITFLPLYGLIGTWTQRIGFHHVWEVYAYNAYLGLFISPYYAYSSTMMSCVSPRGKEYLFFAIFSTINKTSSFIGPFVTSGIIDRTNNTNSGFSFTLALCFISCVLTTFISEKKSRIECEEFLIEEDRKIKMGEPLVF